MIAALRSVAAAILSRTPLGLWPVRIRSGVADGARWTLFPWTSYWRGTHEPAVQAAVMALGGGNIQGWCCWDLGAHFGLYSIGLARRAGPTGMVAAFEPNPVSFERLDRHRRLNRLPWLKLYQAAVSDHNDGSELLTYGNLGTTTTHLPYEGEQTSSETAPIRVRTLRLDDLVASGELRPPRFVKMDVEGHGHRALAGMRNTLGVHRPLILAGIHSPQERDGLLSLIRPLGYRWREIPGAVENPDVRTGTDYLFSPPS